MTATVTPPHSVDKFDDLAPMSGDNLTRLTYGLLDIRKPDGQLWERVAESHAPVDTNTDGIPDNCAVCGNAVHTDAYTGKLVHGFDPAL